VSNLVLAIAGFIFLAVAIIELVGGRWEIALILAAIGLGILFFFRNRSG
jgi:hypothetical protein